MADERPPERAPEVEAQLQTIREHMALVPDEVVSWYLACAASQLAVRLGTTPQGAVDGISERGGLTWDDEEQQRKALRDLTVVTRHRYRGALVQFVLRDHAGN